MQAYAEGFDILRNAHASGLDYHYELNLPDIAEVWRRGSVVGSWLLDLTAMALAESPELSEFSGEVRDSGEGRWTVATAIEEAVPPMSCQQRSMRAFGPVSLIPLPRRYYRALQVRRAR